MTHRTDPQADQPLRLDLHGATALEVVTGSSAIAVIADSDPVVVEGLRPSRRHGGYGRALRHEGKRWTIHLRRAGALRVRCPAGALAAGLALLDRFERYSEETLRPLWVRMGMHWGRQMQRRDDLIGHDVNLASRIAD